MAMAPCCRMLPEGEFVRPPSVRDAQVQQDLDSAGSVLRVSRMRMQRYRSYAEQKSASQFLMALKRCCRMGDLAAGKKLHRDAVAAGLVQSDKHLGAVLIRMYSKCRSMALARQVFDGMIYRDVVTWTCLIQGYVQNGERQVALDLFSSMDCEPDALTYAAALKACGGLACEKKNCADKRVWLQKGIAIHKQAEDGGLGSDIFVKNTLIDMYSKCGSMDRARNVFDRMVSKSVIAWNALILGYVQNGESLVAMELFSGMDCEPDSLTYVAALKACANLASENEKFCADKGMEIHKQLKQRGFEADMLVATTLVDMYSKCGSMNCAREVFDRMVSKDVVTWNSLILGYVQNGESVAAMDLFNSMVVCECEPDWLTYVAAFKACGALASDRNKNLDEDLFPLQRGIEIHKEAKLRGIDSHTVVANSLIDMYSKCGSMDYAREVFDRMSSKNVVTWNSLIVGYVQQGQSLVAVDLFGRMDCEPDAFTYAAVLKACAALGSEDESQKQFILEKGISIHFGARDRGLDSDIFVASSLVDMYSKCSGMDRAKEVFDRMVSKDVVTWTSLILGYVQNGDSSIALSLFTSMDCEPDCRTYAAALKACGAQGALSTGRMIHARICQLGLEGNVNSLMDFYGKCGCTSRAEEIFNNKHSPDTASWNSLITGCSLLGNSALQVFALARKMQEAGVPMDRITFLCILSACSHAGLVEEGKSYFNSMPECGVSWGVEHYNCMIDMLGRANRLEEAVDLVKNMPVEASSVTWLTLLGACRKWNNLEVARIAFDALVAAGKAESSAYVLMSDLYAQNYHTLP